MSDDLLARASAYGYSECQKYPRTAVELICDLAAALREARAESTAWKEKYGDANVWGLQNAARWKDIAERAEAEIPHIRSLLDQATLDYRDMVAERDAMRRDAERYRWLKANARRIDFAGLSWTQGCELDARIDAAIAGGKP